MNRQLRSATTMRLPRAWWLASCLAGCQPTGSQAPLRVKGAAAVTGALNLQVPFATISATELAYALTRSGSPQRQGHFIVDGQNSLRGVIGPLAPGSDYVITLEADARWRDTGSSTSCVANDAFSIYAGQTTALALMLQCDAPPPPAAVGGNTCPVIAAIRAIPGEAPLASEVVLKADVTDVDEGPERLRYAWSADSGAFTDAASARAGFQCTAPGIATVSLIVSDGDPLCPRDAVLVYVTCLEPDVASSPPAAPSAGAAAGAGSATGAAGASVAGGSGSTAAQGGSAGTAGRGGSSGSGVAAFGNLSAAAVSGGNGGAAEAGSSGVLGRLWPWRN
jgi:hypothetical protein